jgi:hypothetical protein
MKADGMTLIICGKQVSLVRIKCIDGTANTAMTSRRLGHRRCWSWVDERLGESETHSRFRSPAMSHPMCPYPASGQVPRRPSPSHFIQASAPETHMKRDSSAPTRTGRDERSRFGSTLLYPVERRARGIGATELCSHHLHVPRTYEMRAHGHRKQCADDQQCNDDGEPMPKLHVRAKIREGDETPRSSTSRIRVGFRNVTICRR